VRRQRRPLASEKLSVRLGVLGDLRKLRAYVTAWAERSDPEMRAMLRWQLLSSSKYFRPLTIFVCHRSVSDTSVPPQVMLSALALELFHNVSLVVDDLLDRSRYRRGRLTLHCRFGTLPAWMAAGYLTACGFDLVGDDTYAGQLLGRLLQRLAVAECLQWRLRRRPLGLKHWEAIAAEDTGSMFEICARLGTRDGRLSRFGRLLGMLYHGCDDVADVRGTSALGGGGNEDLRDGILTLPAAIAVRDPTVAALFQGPLDGNVAVFRASLTGALPEAERHLDRLAATAIAEARRCAARPDALIRLVRQTRGLSAG
jgi:geranylgeranyl diphosphate synthase, type I